MAMAMEKDMNLRDVGLLLRYAKKVFVKNDLLMSSVVITKKELLRSIKTAPVNLKVEIYLKEGLLFISHPSNK